MKYRVTHITQYKYTEPIALSHNILHLRPRDVEGQKCLHFELNVDPFTRELRQRIDSFGNFMHFVSNDEPHSVWTATAKSVIEVDRVPVQQAMDCWRDVAVVDGVSDRLAPSLLEYVVPSPHCPIDSSLADFAKVSFDRHELLWDAVTDLMQRIHRDFKFDPSATYIGISPIEVLALGRGVCQDFSHLMIACLRSMGIAARYVSGHLRTTPPAGQARLIGADASHAWVSVYFPSIGWIDFDPTNAVMLSNDHIVVAYARDFEDVSPAKGVIVGNAWHSLSISVDVEALTPS